MDLHTYNTPEHNNVQKTQITKQPISPFFSKKPKTKNQKLLFQKKEAKTQQPNNAREAYAPLARSRRYAEKPKRHNHTTSRKKRENREKVVQILVSFP